MEGRSEGKRLGIRHPKRGGQRESNVEEQSLCERGGGRRRQAERQKEKQRPRGIQRPSPLTPTLTDAGETDPQTHPLSERGAEGVAWAWQLLSALTVSLCPRRSLSTNPEVASGSSANLPRPEQEGAAEQRQEGPLPAQRPHLPRPRQQLQELQPCSAAWGKGPRVAGQRGSQGLEVRKERGTVCPQWEWPRGTELPRGL